MFGGGGVLFIANALKFNLIPGSPITYWLSQQIVNTFKSTKSLAQIASAKQGLATGKNDKFVRLWFEVFADKVYYNATDSIQAMYTGKKWFPYNKGGSFRKWYGNNDYIINWENNGREIVSYSGSVVRSPRYYFFESISWSKISSGSIAFRYKPCGHIFDVAGCSIFCENDKLMYLLGVTNSNVIMKIIKSIAPTLNYEVGQVAGLPIIFGNEEDVRILVKNSISVSKKDWDSFEESWDFKKHPLI